MSLVLWALGLFFIGGPLLCRAESSCISEFKRVENASTLQELLTIARGLPTAADVNLTAQQEKIRDYITTLRSSLNAYMGDYIAKYKGKGTVLCKHIYDIGANAFQNGEDNLEIAIATDVAKRVRDEYAGKFQTNVDFIEKKIQECGENCTETQRETGLNEVKGKMLYTQSAWCFCTKTKLANVVLQGMGGEIYGENSLGRSEWWLNAMNCESY